VRVKVNYGDGSPEEELDVFDGSVHFHPYEDGEKHEVTVEVLEEDEAEDDDDDDEAEEDDEYDEADDEFDPSVHTVAEVQEYVGSHPDELEAVYDAEVAEKNRSTLVIWLEERLPYDPGSYTVQEVVDYAITNPEQVDDLIAAEKAGKNRSTLITQLEAL
jgi:hypothetical protein